MLNMVSHNFWSVMLPLRFYKKFSFLIKKNIVLAYSFNCYRLLFLKFNIYYIHCLESKKLFLEHPIEIYNAKL